MSNVITVLATASLSFVGLGLCGAFRSHRSTDLVLIEELREQLQRCGTDTLPAFSPVYTPFESPFFGYFALFGLGLVGIAACTGAIWQLSRYLASIQYTSRIGNLVPEGTELAGTLSLTLDVVGRTPPEGCRSRRTF